MKTWATQKEHTAFADGVQDDILTKLAKIADLKVISRTSVMEYRGKRNIRQIGDALRVSHVLEGSARRSGDRIHLNAQLIDTRTDTHVWAEEYDRDLNDLFAVQSEIAQKVAQHLHAKLSASEKASVEERPTQDLVAYDFYVRAVSMIYNAQVPTRPVELQMKIFPRLWTCLIRQLLVILTSFSPIASWLLCTI